MRTVATGGLDSLDAPPQELISGIRARFPVEPGRDRQVSTLHARGTDRYVPATREQLSDGILALLVDALAEPFTISEQRWLAGGASNVQMSFTLEWEDPDRGRVEDRLLVRMDASDALHAASKLREHQLLGVLAAALPVPRSLWVDADARYFPQPAIITSLVEGVSRPSGSTGGPVSGVGATFTRRLRAQLAPQFIDHLAILHQRTRLEGHDLSAFTQPRPGTSEAALWQLNDARRVWEVNRGEDVPLMEVAASWLERNLPRTARVSIVHGDYRSGKFLFDEPSGRITAWLDWERAHFGDGHLDLAWAIHPLFGHYDDTEESGYLISGLLSRSEFLDVYAMATGWEVDETRLRWYEILTSYVLLTRTLASAYRVVRLGRSQHDILLARAEGIAPVAMKELKRLLEEVV